MSSIDVNPLSANPIKWLHTQTIRWQIADELSECVDHIVGLALKGLIIKNYICSRSIIRFVFVAVVVVVRSEKIICELGNIEL